MEHSPPPLSDYEFEISPSSPNSMHVETPELVDKIERLSLNDTELYVANLNKTKFSTGMASKHGNQLGVTVLNHIKMLYINDELTEDKLKNLIKNTKSEYLQHKSLGISRNLVRNFNFLKIYSFLDESLNVKNYKRDYQFNRGGTFCYVDLRKSILTCLNDKNMMDLIWEEKNGKKIFFIHKNF